MARIEIRELILLKRRVIREIIANEKRGRRGTRYTIFIMYILQKTASFGQEKV